MTVRNFLINIAEWVGRLVTRDDARIENRFVINNRNIESKPTSQGEPTDPDFSPSFSRQTLEKQPSAFVTTPSPTVGSKNLLQTSAVLGIEFASDWTTIVAEGKVVLREPSVVAVNSSGRLIAVGEEAKKMLGRTPQHIVALQPLFQGVILDKGLAEILLRNFITEAHSHLNISSSRQMFAISGKMSSEDTRAIVEIARRAGAEEVFVINSANAAAIGARLPVSEVRGSMIVCIGDNVTEVAVISMGGTVVGRSTFVAGNALSEAVSKYMKTAHQLNIGVQTAEEIKVRLGSAYPMNGELQMEIRGLHQVSGLPRTVTITSGEIREALLEPVNTIVEAVRVTLEECPPELAMDIVDSGITLVGGGALLQGLDELISHDCEVPVHIADDPLSCVALGAAAALQDPYSYLREW